MRPRPFEVECGHSGCAWTYRSYNQERANAFKREHEAQAHWLCRCGRRFLSKNFSSHVRQMRRYRPETRHERVEDDVNASNGNGVAQPPPGRSVLQDWVHGLTFMMQAVLLTAVRGPDGLHKDHISKVLLRWYRRCILISAFHGRVLEDPYSDDGGSFTGPCVFPNKFKPDIELAVDEYLRSTDEVPHHYHMHLTHAAEILGYKHPVPKIREFWNTFYRRLVRDAHLSIETEQHMDFRLGDNRDNWRASEEVTAR